MRKARPAFSPILRPLHKGLVSSESLRRQLRPWLHLDAMLCTQMAISSLSMVLGMPLHAHHGGTHLPLGHLELPAGLVPKDIVRYLQESGVHAAHHAEGSVCEVGERECEKRDRRE